MLYYVMKDQNLLSNVMLDLDFIGGLEKIKLNIGYVYAITIGFISQGSKL